MAIQNIYFYVLSITADLREYLQNKTQRLDRFIPIQPHSIYESELKLAIAICVELLGC
jgi:hypothetical protein